MWDSFKNLGATTTSHTTASGRSYSWYYKPRRRKSPARSEMRIPLSRQGLEFGIKPEGWADGIAKALGFATEFQTSDLDFDGKFYISSDDAQFCNLLRGASMRQEIKALFTQGVRELHARESQLLAEMTHATSDPPTHAGEIAEALYGIDGSIARLSLNPASPCRSLAAQAKWTVNILIGALVAGVLSLGYYPYKLVDDWALARDALMYALPLIAAMLFLVREFFKGSSRGVTVFYTALLAGIPACLMLTHSTLYYLNTRWDGSEAVERRQYVLGTHMERGSKGSARYYIDVDHWREGHEKFSVKTDYQAYSRARVGNVVLFKTHPGYLGAEWIEGYEVY